MVRQLSCHIPAAGLWLALLPAALLFLVASNLITTSVDSWFNIQVEESLDKALDVGQTYSRASQDSVSDPWAGTRRPRSPAAIWRASSR